MVTFADTSFLFSLYGNDVHSVVAAAWVKKAKVAIYISELGEFELGNALRFTEFRKALPAGSAASFWSSYETDRSAGRIVVERCNLASVVAEGKRLSTVHTLKGGHRAFDILHVAAAIHSHARRFLTFDSNQKRLAESEGLKVPV